MSSFNYKVPGYKLQEDLINSAVPQTLWQKIYLYLKKLGYQIYSPGQKRDKSEQSYVVLKESGQFGQDGNKVGYKLIDVIIYHPIANYSTMEFYTENIKQDLRKIKEIRATGNETPAIVDSEVQAYTTSIEYQTLKTLRR